MANTQNSTFTFKLPPSGSGNVREALERASFVFTTAPDAAWQARKQDTITTFYNSGKLVIQGGHAIQLVDWLSGKNLLPALHRPDHTDRIGTDEAGKGDYFGPLVTAGVLVTFKTEKQLMLSGVRDSKTLSDETVRRLSIEVKQVCPHSIVSIGPARYNELQGKLKTVNKVLGWSHARAIENILERHDCTLAISDQFGDERFIRNALQERGRTIELLQMHRAEQDVAVAAASILARAEFLERLRRLCDQFRMTFPKGASTQVVEAARKFVSTYGSKRLTEVAKVHFKTTAEVLA